MKRFDHQGKDFKWTDIEAPTQESFSTLAEKFKLPLKSLISVLDPENLPKCEIIGDVCFLSYAITTPMLNRARARCRP
jgi:Mg2+ and Co2+ transporter CorA